MSVPFDIAYIVNARMPTEKAHGYQITKMCASFAAAGARVTLYVPHRRGADAPQLYQTYQVPPSFTTQVLDSWDPLPLEPLVGPLAFYAQSWSFMRTIRQLSLPKNTVVYTRNPEVAWVMGQRGYRVAYECHDWFSPHRRARALRMLQRTQVIIATNRFIAQEFLDHGTEAARVLVAENGVDLSVFGRETPRDMARKELHLEKMIPDLAQRVLLLYTGSLRTKGEEKGVDLILRTLQKLHDPRCVFLAVGGSEEDMALYREQAREYGVENQTYWVGRVAQTDLARYYASAEMLLMPFPDAQHYRLHMSPLKMFEYMASARPIIASDLPSLREIMGDDGAWYVPPDDAEAFVRALCALVADPEKRTALAQAARARAQQYSWDARVQKILSRLGQV